MATNSGKHVTSSFLLYSAKEVNTSSTDKHCIAACQSENLFDTQCTNYSTNCNYTKHTEITTKKLLFAKFRKYTFSKIFQHVYFLFFGSNHLLQERLKHNSHFTLSEFKIVSIVA